MALLISGSVMSGSDSTTVEVRKAAD